MNKSLGNRSVITGFLALTNVLVALIYLSILSENELRAQQQNTISVVRATALPLVNTEGNQVKVVLNYSMGESFLGERMNAVMGIYDRKNGSLIKLSSFPNGFVLNNTEGTIQLTSTLTDPKIQNISTIVTLTNAEKSEKYTNDVRSDLDLESILPTLLPALTLDETSTPPPTESNGEGQATGASDDDSNSNSGEE
ncbi:MAG: hypothetical protein ACREAS_01770 [Nitrososphaera sp.]